MRQALVNLDVPYPVAIDNEWTTWRLRQSLLAGALYDRQGWQHPLPQDWRRPYGGGRKVLQALLAEPI
ncbi:MAG: hypothetical protein R2911_38540 [Caldilineaceae bacterium]